MGIVTIGVNGGFGQLEEWRVPAGDPNGKFMVTVPVGSASSKIPDRASRIERINNWVAAVLSVEGGGCSG